MNISAENLSSLVDRVADHVRARFAAEGSGHDWHHIHRVWMLARQIGEAEGAEPQVTALGALLEAAFARHPELLLAVLEDQAIVNLVVMGREQMDGLEEVVSRGVRGMRVTDP